MRTQKSDAACMGKGGKWGEEALSRSFDWHQNRLNRFPWEE